MKHIALAAAVALALSLACEEKEAEDKENEAAGHPGISAVEPVDIDANDAAFGFLAKMQGHWVGSNVVTAEKYPWFTYDYRAISASHVFGIHEGGTLGNILTSFYVANFKGTKTIMARNGGVLGRIYRSSYFVLDEVSSSDGKDCYQFVDAKGGKNIMWMAVCFSGDTIDFKAYRSRLGRTYPPELHMDFKATKKHPELASTAATALSFPAKTVERDFAEGFVEEHLYRNPGTEKPVSATFLSQSTGDLATRAAAARDPFAHKDHGHVSELSVEVTRGAAEEGKKIFILLSKDALTDSNGQVGGDAALDTIFQLPSLEPSASSFTFSYLHPGSYFLTVIVDTNDDGTFSKGDTCSISRAIDIAPESKTSENVSSLGTTY